MLISYYLIYVIVALIKIEFTIKSNISLLGR
jgi:hypothetical protein